MANHRTREALKSHLATNNYVDFRDLFDSKWVRQAKLDAKLAFKETPAIKQSAIIVVKAMDYLHSQNNNDEARVDDHCVFLHALIKGNPDHTLMVIADSTIVNQNGELNLTQHQIPGFLKGLIISDPDQIISSIGHWFLKDTIGLTAFGTSGFYKVREIKDYFLHGASGLTQFDSSGLTNVRKIGSSFLRWTALKEIDTSGFTNVEKVGGFFLDCAAQLQAFDTSGFRNLRVIDGYFLANPSKLRAFDCSGFINLRIVGDYFLAHPRELVEFHSQGLEKVKKVADHFLSGAEKLTDFRTSGFINVEVIGANFLSNAQKLTTFVSTDFKNVIEIGDHMLFKATRLEEFDSSGFCSVSRIGAYFLEGSQIENAKVIKAEILASGFEAYLKAQGQKKRKKNSMSNVT